MYETDWCRAECIDKHRDRDIYLLRYIDLGLVSYAQPKDIRPLPEGISCINYVKQCVVKELQDYVGMSTCDILTNLLEPMSNITIASTSTEDTSEDLWISRFNITKKILISIPVVATEIQKKLGN